VTSDFEKTIALVAAAQRGDEQATECLFTRYYPIVLKIAEVRLGRRLRGNLEAEDIAQETLTAAFHGLDRFEMRSEGGFKHWLSRLVENRIIDHDRAGRTVKRGAGKVVNTADLGVSSLSVILGPGRSATPSQYAGANELEARIEDAMSNQLSDTHREVLVMRKLCGMPYEEIAEKMGYSDSSSVRTLHSRAMKELHELIK
jgi:RNA polymerase sigma factor (sigma-70 family)